MKKIVLAFIFAFFVVSLNAQDELPTAKGNKLINIGTGMLGGSGGVNLTPVHIGFDYFIINNLSLGFDANWIYYLSKDIVGNPHLFSGQAVIDYHFNELMNLPSAWDFYAGVKLGAGYMNTDKALEVNELAYKRGVKFVFNGRVGFRYYFNEKIGVNSEVGILSVSGTKTSGVTFMLGISTKL